MIEWVRLRDICKKKLTKNLVTIENATCIQLMFASNLWQKTIFWSVEYQDTCVFVNFLCNVRPSICPKLCLLWTDGSNLRQSSVLQKKLKNHKMAYLYKVHNSVLMFHLSNTLNNPPTNLA